MVDAGKDCFNGAEFGGGVGNCLVKRVVHIEDIVVALGVVEDVSLRQRIASVLVGV